MAKRPSFQFYPGDWLRDVSLRRVSPVARALWIDMLCLMHDGEPYGHLRSGGADIEMPELSRATGFTPGESRRAIQELERAGVFSRTDGGTIYSRRMVRDERLRNVRAASGRLGGNPNLVNGKVGNLVNQTAEQKPTPSSSSSSAIGEPSVLSSNPDGFDLTDPGVSPEAPAQNPAKAEESQCIQRLWGKYVVATRRNPRVVTLTPARKNKGLARLHECLRKSGGDLATAEALMELAIERIAASDWHMGRNEKTGGKRYCEWESHLFGSAETLERWLADEGREGA